MVLVAHQIRMQRCRSTALEHGTTERRGRTSVRFAIAAQAWAAAQEQVLVVLADLQESYPELRREMAQG